LEENPSQDSAEVKDQSSPDKTVQMDLKEDLNFEYTDPGLIEEDTPAPPSPGTNVEDGVVMLNLSPIKKEDDKEPDKPAKMVRDLDVHVNWNGNRFADSAR